MFVRIRFFVLLCVLTAGHLAAQKSGSNFTKQLTLAADNDVFALRGTDGYYTNGLFINFSKVKTRKKPSTVKTIFNYEIAQKIFTPGIREVYVFTEIDRPITGYLYGKFSVKQFRRNNQLWSYGLSIGTIGKNAQAEKLVNLFHPFIKINSQFWDWIWQYQLKNEVGFNAYGSFATSLLNHHSISFLQISPFTNFTAGTNLTSLSQSVVLQLGKHNEMRESEFWGSNLTNNTSEKIKPEFFFFYQPQVTYQLYSATVQGGLFADKEGTVTSKVAPFVFSHEMGVMATAGRYSAGFRLTFQTREAQLQQNNHAYGRLQFGYKLH